MLQINTFHYSPEDVDCTRCAKYGGKKRGCTVKACPWLAERIEAGVVGYEEAVRDTFPHDAHLDARLRTVVHRFTGSLFLTPAHERRMERIKAEQGYRRKRDTPAYYAAMYLLTANGDLCRRTANCFCKHGIEFGYADLRGIPPHDFTLFSAARDIYTDSCGTMVSDLANAEVVDTLAFSLIVNALLVARYGCPVLKITDREGKT